MPHTYYEVLGVSSNATEVEIRAAYRQAVLRLHPDKQSAAGPANHDQYQEVQLAWTVGFANFHLSHYQHMPALPCNHAALRYASRLSCRH